MGGRFRKKKVEFVLSVSDGLIGLSARVKEEIDAEGKDRMFFVRVRYIYEL